MEWALGCAPGPHATAASLRKPALRAPSASRYMLTAMDQNLTALERAFRLAKSGRVKDLEEIRMLLRREGYDVSQLQGPRLRSQLRKLINGATAPDAPGA